MRTLLIALVSMLSLNASAQAAQKTCVDAIKEDLRIIMCLSKQQYLPGEPIIADVSIVNLSGETCRLAGPEYIRPVIEQIKGDEPIPQQLVPAMPAPDPDDAWDIIPGRKLTRYSDVQIGYPIPLPVGEYTIRAIYRAPEQFTDSWQGKIETEPIFFSIVSGSSEEARVTQEFNDAKSKIMNNRETAQAAAVMKSLSDPKTGGVFSPYAGYYEARAHIKDEDKTEYRKLLRSYSEKNKNIPFYGNLAICDLGTSYYYEGNYNEARSIFITQKEDSQRRYWIKKCDDAIARQEEQIK